MSKRNFPNFLEAYAAYARDNWCPNKFHFWSGISIICAALERKVWMLQDVNPYTIHYPNLYIMLVAAPGDGKTTAGVRAIKLLKEVTSPEGLVNFVPTKITDAALMKALKTPKNFYVSNQQYTHSSAYYFAGEASNALKAIKGGDEIFPTITQAYDCEDSMEKATLLRGPEIIKFPCMNVLACSTFDNLKGMLTDGGILGGFVSRFLFVVNDEQLIRTPEIVDVAVDRPEDPTVSLLIQDLQEIYQLTGRFVPDSSYREFFKKFHPANDAARYLKETEKEQSILARKGSAIVKLSMVLSAAESSEMILRGEHWKLAVSLIEDLETKYDKVVAIAQVTSSQEGIDSAILREVRQHRNGCSEAELVSKLARNSVKRKDAVDSIRSMLTQTFELERVMINGKPGLKSVPQGSAR